MPWHDDIYTSEAPAEVHALYSAPNKPRPVAFQSTYEDVDQQQQPLYEPPPAQMPQAAHIADEDLNVRVRRVGAEDARVLLRERARLVDVDSDVRDRAARLTIERADAVAPTRHGSI